MVMQNIFIVAASAAAKLAAFMLLDNLARDPTARRQAEIAAAHEQFLVRQAEVLARLQGEGGAIAVSSAVSGETVAVCPACSLFDEVALGLSYAESISDGCKDDAALAPGTVVQVRDHVQNAIAACGRIGAERPAFGAVAGVMQEGLRGMLAGLEGGAVTCGAVRQAEGLLRDARSAANRVAEAWWAKPAEKGEKPTVSHPQPG